MLQEEGILNFPITVNMDKIEYLIFFGSIVAHDVISSF